MPSEQKKFQEEMDAGTLSEAEAIRANKARMAGAKRGAARLVKEAEARARGLRKVSKAPGRTVKKIGTTRKKTGRKN